MPEKKHPRRGSLAHAPRKRTSKQRPRVRSWPEESEVQILGFPGYKAGMTHVFMVDDHPGRATEGQEVNIPVTVLEVPPLRVCAIRVYGKDRKGEKVLAEVWAEDLSEDLEKMVKLPEEYDQDVALESSERIIGENRGEEVFALIHTQPRLGSVSKKKPEVMEVQVGGDSVGDRWEHAKSLLGNEVRFSEIFGEGGYVDVFSVTKGKGFEGPVQRWGVKVQPRKVQQARRHTGVLGPWRPSRIMRTAPMSGQSGHHQRMEYNKRVLKVGEDGDDITPEGGFLRFGEVKNDYVILKGSVPGPTNRLVFMRAPMRQKEGAPSNPPTIAYIDTSSQQGG